MNNEEPQSISIPLDKPENVKELLELQRLRLERTKLAIETRLKRRELAGHGTKSLRETFANPLVLAIVGGSLTLLTSMVTNYLTATANRDADTRRASQTREAETRALQSQLIKSFLKTPDSKTARDNLTFLIESGLIPDHEDRIKKYLENNIKSIPKISDVVAKPIQTANCLGIDLGLKANLPRPDVPIGASIHLGTNRLDPSAYGGWDGPLTGSVGDANSMQRLATALGYKTHLRIDAQARRDCLFGDLSTLAELLRSGDTLMLTMSGHGGQVSDTTGSEPDKKEETWVMFDGQILASELSEVFSKFKSGVTIIVVEDLDHAAVFRRSSRMAKLEANLLVLGGSAENQTAMDGQKNSEFTAALLSVWNEGKFSGSYDDLMQIVRKNFRSTQTPQIYTYGPDADLSKRRPFELTKRK